MTACAWSMVAVGGALPTVTPLPATAWIGPLVKRTRSILWSIWDGMLFRSSDWPEV
jgi:hypothetical protein